MNKNHSLQTKIIEWVIRTALKHLQENEAMNIHLDPELESLIQSQLNTHQYQSPEQVLEAALKLLIASQQQKAQASQSPWDILEELAGTIEAPDDWSAERDRYLYGTPKRNSNHE
ncbi:hypothetical protein VB711_22470 [Cronbergia sp. UHCC 0137]|uniref:ribbon-helix-helix domain-containing protein n=1 Tax=Cronbergia sp. UHCC 0137 TaxID=3110239 RepID=UPI002B21DB3C|nr:hypothetical protein [Cronbergia sp. UHCC 0137]MEA5620582.1 hypothetical protein [Cronbergia sp. UHCC 0137]